MNRQANGSSQLHSYLPPPNLEEDEKFVEQMAYLHQIAPSAECVERSLRIAMEKREIELNRQYLESFQKVNEQVQSFVEKIREMNSICHDLTNRIQANKEKSRDLLNRTTVLQNEKKVLSHKQEYLVSFFTNYSLTADEEKVLEEFGKGSSASAPSPDAFFKAFTHLHQVLSNVRDKLAIDGETPALTESFTNLGGKLDASVEVLFQYLQRECRLLNVEIVDMKVAICHAFELLQLRPELMKNALAEYASARSSHVVRTLVDALTKGGKGHRPIEHASNDPLRYVTEMCTWMHSAILTERELLASMLRSCHQLENAVSVRKELLADITEAACQPLKLRLEQMVMREVDCVLLYHLSTVFLYYHKTFEAELAAGSVLLKLFSDLHELSVAMFYGAITSNVQRILSNIGVPDYDLLPVNAVHQALILMRDILESQGGDSALTAMVDKKELYSKIFTHILDPLNQTIQLVCSNLHNALDVAVYMLNCLNAIRSVVILYPYTDARLEMIKAQIRILRLQIEANEDVLVSEQASMILTNNDLMVSLYTKCVAHQPNQGPLSKITGMEEPKVAAALTVFNDFLERGPSLDEVQCSQAVKIASTRIRESVKTRTMENVLAAYNHIHQALIKAENLYGQQVLSTLKSVEMVKNLLSK